MKQQKGYGSDDLKPIASSQEWTDTLPNARLVLLSDVGHYRWLECSDTFSLSLSSFPHASQTTLIALCLLHYQTKMVAVRAQCVIALHAVIVEYSSQELAYFLEGLLRLL